ncbi:MAG TPA: FAD-binding oxidoreductase, partial [Methylomirabilota bacterium]|nr:FAD-binding oxidoreductase [Methylomirabilota bacterium]
MSAALHLAERGVGVAVLDAAEPGWGASGRNGGQIIPGLKHDPDELERQFGRETGRRMWQIAGGAADFVFELIARHKISCHAQQCGWIAAAPHAAALESVRSRTEQWLRRGAAVELLDRRRIQELTGTTGYVGGMLDRRAGALQPLAFVRGLAWAAQRAGAAIHGGSLVRGLEVAPGGWRVDTQAGSVTARSVILATNAYTDDLWPGLRRT